MKNFLNPASKLLTAFFILLLTSVQSVMADEADDSSQRAVLITGASSGIGYRMMEVLSANGFIVYAGARTEENLAKLEAMENVEAIRLDVTIQADIDAAVKTVADKGRGLYGLINNAGISIFGPMTEVSEEQLEFLFDVNVKGPYRVTQAFAPMLVASKGRLVTTGSISGTHVNAMMGQYSMSKFAVEAMTDAWAQELGPTGVKVSVIEPGAFGTNIGNAALARLKSENYWPESTAYKELRDTYFSALANFEKGADPLPVAEAALEIMQTDEPRARYMVTPNQEQATRTIIKLLNRAVQQNSGHEHSLSRAKMLELLTAELDKSEAE